MAEEIRVVIIKLADRLHNMRTLHGVQPDKQKRIARETLEIFAPLANRLGIYTIRRELEDLALFYLEPEKYKEIEALLAEDKDGQQSYIRQAITILREKLPHGYNRFVKFKWIIGVVIAINALSYALHLLSK